MAKRGVRGGRAPRRKKKQGVRGAEPPDREYFFSTSKIFN